MSAHEGVSCDACGKSNFRCKRYKCLICYDYDLCATCYEHGETSSHHTIEHPMQCILTRQDFDFYYHGERCTSDQPQSLTCPFCGEMGLSLPFSYDSSSMTNPLQSFDLFHHLQLKHGDDQQSSEVICPICAAMANGEPNLMTGDLLSHIANDHQQTSVQTPSSVGSSTNPYSRQTSNRDIDFTGGSSSSNGRASFRRGPLRAPGRRGSGIGRGGGTVSQHFIVDPSAVSGATDPIADLLTQLSTVRRLAAANNNASSSSSSSSNTINLQALTRQQYERERLRAAGRLTQQTSSSTGSTTAAAAASNNVNAANSSSTSNLILSNENDFFDSLFSSALLIDPSTPPTSNVTPTWAQIVTQQQQQQQPIASEQQQQSTTKSSTVESDQSLLKKLCEDSSPSGTSTNSTNINVSKRRHDFVHSLLLSSFICPLNDNDK